MVGATQDLKSLVSNCMYSSVLGSKPGTFTHLFVLASMQAEYHCNTKWRASIAPAVPLPDLSHSG